MKKNLSLFSLVIGLLVGMLNFNFALAGNDEIKKTFSSIGLNEIEILPSPINGIATVLTPSGIFYISDDGKNLIQGPLLTIMDGKIMNRTNQLLVQKMNQLEPDMIIYKAKHEKYVVTVFTDISCSYCRKLHDDMKGYNDLGITIRYLAFPRSGVDSPVGQQMQAIWCSTNKVKSFEQVHQGEELVADCPLTKMNIADQYKLGVQFGVRGTPALVLSNGDLLPGYLSPNDLKAELDKRLSSI